MSLRSGAKRVLHSLAMFLLILIDVAVANLKSPCLLFTVPGIGASAFSWPFSFWPVDVNFC